MRRLTRLTNAFPKKIDKHNHALSLYFMCYNFVRVYKTLKMTPLMASASDWLWSMEDIVMLVDANAPKRGGAGRT